MDAAHDPGRWHEFAVAVAGAAAALAGLVVVAMSINIKEIIAAPGLPRRAASALLSLTAPLIASLLVLVPDQSDRVLGVELVVLAAAFGVPLVIIDSRSHRSSGQTSTQWFFGTALPSVLLVGATLVAGFGMTITGLGGLYWLPVMVIAGFGGALGQAWVLLVEILR